MSLVYNRLFSLLEEKGYSATYWLRQQGMHPATVNKLRKNERVNADTINELCRLLDCQPGDLMEYVADNDNEKSALKRQIIKQKIKRY